jgi:hypothetical protein
MFLKLEKKNKNSKILYVAFKKQMLRAILKG